ncbi:MAG: hypothetical protein JWR69_3569 [Pedosphaera sp.]|nr:hypothetical protein [Pedosphaera sp.]
MRASSVIPKNEDAQYLSDNLPKAAGTMICGRSLAHIQQNLGPTRILEIEEKPE